MAKGHTQQLRMHNSLYLLFSAIALVLLPFKAGAADITSIRGVGIFESSDFSGIQVSYGGGADILVSGYAMDYTASSNQVVFTTSDLSTSEIRIPGPALSCKLCIIFIFQSMDHYKIISLAHLIWMVSVAFYYLYALFIINGRILEV